MSVMCVYKKEEKKVGGHCWRKMHVFTCFHSLGDTTRVTLVMDLEVLILQIIISDFNHLLSNMVQKY